jgi:hypothetical protein
VARATRKSTFCVAHCWCSNDEHVLEQKLIWIGTVPSELQQACYQSSKTPAFQQMQPTLVKLKATHLIAIQLSKCSSLMHALLKHCQDWLSFHSTFPQNHSETRHMACPASQFLISFAVRSLTCHKTGECRRRHGCRRYTKAYCVTQAITNQFEAPWQKVAGGVRP